MQQRNDDANDDDDDGSVGVGGGDDGDDDADDDDDDDHDDDDGQLGGPVLPPEEATCIAARCSYLQPNRPDIQYAAKDVRRPMANPTARAWEMLKHIGRYLHGEP